MIKTSKHFFNKQINKSKYIMYKDFYKECTNVANQILSFMWNNSITLNDKTLDIKNNQLDCPSFIPIEIYDQINIQTDLSARAVKCISTQVCSVIKAVITKQKNRYKQLKIMQLAGKNTTYLEKKINETNYSMPHVNWKFEFNSICCDIKKVNGYFNAFLQLKCLGKKYGQIRIPIKFHRHSNKFKCWQMKASFLLSENYLDIRWEKEEPELKSEGEILGADQGIKTVVTFSNNINTPIEDKDGHSFDSIIKKLSRKRKGSKNFKKVQEHRKNFINWSLNQINFCNIKEVKLEKLKNVRKGQKTSRYLNHFSYPLIEKKLQDKCLEEGVRFTLDSNVYFSQRCHKCGWVQKSNRKSKQFKCKKCCNELDADLNSAINHTLELFELPFGIWKLKLNKTGFYWLEKGLYHENGEELTVLHVPRTE